MRRAVLIVVAFLAASAFADVGHQVIPPAPLVFDGSGYLKVNVAAGGAGGGLAQLQTRTGTTTWSDVGTGSGAVNLPVAISSALPSGSNAIGGVTVNNSASTPVYSAVTDTSNTVVKPGDAGNNAIRVNVVAGGASGGTSSSFASGFPGTGTASGAKVVNATPTLTSGNMEAPELTTAGRLIVDGSQVTQPVAGTLTPSTSMGTSPMLSVGSEVTGDGSVSAYTSGNAEHFHEDTQGRLIVRDYHPNFWTSDVSTGSSTVSATTQVAGLSGSGQSYYITDVILSNGASAQTIAVVSSTTAGNACATSPANVIPPISLAANGGMAMAYKTPIKVTANSALCCKISGSSAFSCQLRGFTAP